MLMKNKFSKFINLQGKYLTSLLILLTLGIGQMWGAETILATFRVNLDANPTSAYASYSDGDADYTCNKVGSNSSSNYANVGGQYYMKLTANDAYVKIKLKSGSIAVGDKVYVYHNHTSNKNGVGFAMTSGGTNGATGNATANTELKLSYTLTAGDIAGDGSISIYRQGSNLYVGKIEVAHPEDETPTCPSGLTISSKNDQVSFTEGEKIELSAALSAGNGTITYQWYKGSVAPANAISGATNAKYEVNSCTTADGGDYFCVASKTSCSDAVNASAFTISVAADTKCFNMPAITSKPADLAHVTVTGGTLSDVSTAKSVAMNAAGLKLDGNNVYLKVTLTGASIVTGTKITVAWKNAGSGAGIALVNENLEEKVIDETSVSTEGSASHTFTAAEAANYADEFIIHRNASGTGIYVNAITVEDCGPAIVKHTVTLEYADGATADGSLLVADGKTAAQPADPTWAHHRFDGWYNGASPYDWSATVSGDLTLTAHWTQLYTITYAAGDGTATGDAPTQVDKAENETFEVAANTFAVAGKDFEKWNDGTNDYAPGDTYTVGTADVVLTAQWKAEADKYTVIFKDGESTLDTKSFEVGTNPSDAGVDKTKALNTFAAWQKDAADIALNDAFWATVVKDATVTLTARWTKAYATNVDFETEAVGHASDEDYAKSIVDAHNYALSTKTGTTFDENTSTNNGAYLGLKIKNSGTTLSWNVVAGKVVELKAGVMVANGSLAINGGAATTIDGGSITAGNDNFKIHYFYSAAEALYEFTTSNGSAEVIKAITMRDPYEVSFDANEGDPVAAQYGYPSVTLPLPTKGTENFAGWYTDADEFVGMNGDSYTPTADIELVAHWEALSTVNTLSDLKVDGVTVDGFSADVHTYYIVLPYGTDVASLPKITAATPTNENASVAIWPAEGPAWTDDFGGCYRQQANVTPQDPTAAVGYNDIRITIAPKDGVSIIKVATTGGTNKTVTGLYAGDGDVNLSSSTKMDNGKYIGFILDGTTLQAGDKINVHTTTAANTEGSHIIFYDNMTNKNELYETGEIGGAGNNIFTINAAMVGATTAYVYRSNADAAHQWNGYVDYIEVTRAMDPVLTAISFDGVAAEKGTGNTFSATLPNGTDLAAMTITPTIVWNGAGTAAAANAWEWDVANTYTVTDKDGDATVYTITLTEAVPAVDPTLTYDDGAYVVGLSALDLSTLISASTSDGAITYSVKTDGGTSATIDGNNFTATTAGTAVITASQAATVAYNAITFDFNVVVTVPTEIDGIKMVEDGALTGNFVSARTLSNGDNTIEGIAYTKYLTMSSTMTSFGNEVAPSATKGIYYYPSHKNIRFYFYVHNNQSSAKKIYIYTVDEDAEGTSDATSANVSVDPGRHLVYADVELTKHAAVVFGVENTGTQICQIVAVESGDELLQGGEAGYTIDYNKCYISPKAGTVSVYDGIEYKLYADAKLVSATNVQLQTLGTDYIKFHLDAPMTVNVFADNKKYYVGSECSTDEAAMLYEATGDGEFTLAAGNWYINGSGAQVKINKLSFMLPKCAEPTIDAQPVTNVTFGAGNLTASVTAHVNDGGTLSYQWYNASDDSEVTGADEATLTTTTEGTYYVIVTNTLADHSDNFIKSAEATLGYRTLNDATLSALSYGDPETAIALEADKYEYRVILNEGTTDVPALHATATMNPYPTVTITNAASFTDYNAQSTVHVLAEDGLTELTYTVNFVVKHIYTALEDVTESTTWNWTGSVDQTINDVPNKGVIIANYIEGDNFEKIEGKAGEYARRNQNGGVYQGTYLHFNTTVPGRVKFYFRAPSGGENCTITVKNGGRTVVAGTRGNSLGWSDEVFVNGDVVVEMVNDKEGGGTTRVQQVVFTAATPDYTRDVRQGYYGTICLPNGGVMVGAMLYEVAYFGETSQKIFFDNIPSGEMEAGIPYVFLPNDGVSQLAVYYTDDANASATNRNGLYGSYSKTELPSDGSCYILLNNQYCQVLSAENYVGANKAYFKLGDITPTEPALAPGRHRIALGGQGSEVATGMENINADEAPMKVMINGELFILLGDKMYDATGRLVK